MVDMVQDDQWELNHYKSLPTSALLQFALSGGADEWIAATTALDRISNYLMAAGVQMQRIWSDLQASETAFRASAPQDQFGSVNWEMHSQGFDLQKMAFIDIHFYFTCWDTIRKMLRFLTDEVKSLITPGEVFDRYKTMLDHYSDARHDLEHFDERQPGKRHAAKAVSPPDSMVSGSSYLGYGNLSDGEYRFGARSWDVTPSSLNLLEGIVAELDAGLRSEAISLLIEQSRSKKPKGTEI